MKNRVSATLALLLLFVCPALSRAQSPSAATGKVGILNIQAAILNTAEGKKVMADLDKKYQPKRTELQRMQQEIQSLQDQIQRQDNVTSDASQQQLSRQLDEKKKIFTRTQEDAQSDFASDRSEAIGRISQKIGKVVQDYAEKNGYSVILDLLAPVYSSSGQIGDAQVPVYYAGKDVEITGEIVKLYDAANPVASATTTPETGTTTKPPATKTPVKPK